MGIIKRIFGICDTKPPGKPGSWNYSKNRVEIDLDFTPELSKKDGAVRLEGGDLPTRILVIHCRDGIFRAFENRCSHMGRRIDPMEGAPSIRCCSVSKSTYDYSGNPVGGAAKKPIKTFNVERSDGKLGIDLE